MCLNGCMVVIKRIRDFKDYRTMKNNIRPYATWTVLALLIFFSQCVLFTHVQADEKQKLFRAP